MKMTGDSDMIVSEVAIRGLVRELLYVDAPAVVNELPFQDTSVPLEASPEMDTTYRAYDKLYSVPIGTELVPHDKKELEIALRGFIEDAPECAVSKLYHKIQRVFDEVTIEDDDSEGIEMKTSTNKVPMTSNVEEAVRRTIRKIMEAPDMHGALNFSGYDYQGEHDDDEGPLKRKRDINLADKSDPSKITLPQLAKKKHDLKSRMASMSPEEKAAAERDLADTDQTREMTHDEMMPYLGHKGPQGVKGEEFRTLEKVKFLANMDPQDRANLMNTARGEYIDFLASGGDLEPEEVEMLKSNPTAVEELDGFREWLDAYVWDDLEADDPVHYIEPEKYDNIRKDKLEKGIEPAWPKGPKGEPVNKAGDWTNKQRVKANKSTDDRAKERKKEK